VRLPYSYTPSRTSSCRVSPWGPGPGATPVPACTSAPAHAVGGRFLVPQAAVFSAAGLGPCLSFCSHFLHTLHTGVRHVLLSMQSCRVVGVYQAAGVAA
jgi:hypothetical protein